MRQTLSILLFITLAVSAAAQTKAITLEDIWSNGTFQTKGGPWGIRFRNDGVHYTALSEGRVEELDIRTGQKTATLFDAATATSPDGNWKGVTDGYVLSSDEQHLLLSTGTQSIYRWSTKAQFYTADPSSKTVTPLYTGSLQRYATFSPDASKVAFVVNNNLFYKNLSTGNTAQVTTDGKENEIINGASDWVYEEEFELVRAFEWSPDGRYLAYLRFDEREVPEMKMERYNGGEYPEIITYKYPKVGEKNSVVTAHIYDLKSGKTVAVETGAAADDYLPRIAWTPKGELCVTRMNRHQNHLWLLTADPESGKTDVLFEEENKYYLDLVDPVFLADGSGFIWESPKSGYNHLYRYDMKGKEKAALTKGNFDVTSFLGVDEKNGTVFFQAAANDPMHREIYSVKLKDKKAKLNKISDDPGFHGAQFSKSFDYWINSYSTINSAPQYFVRDREGKMVRKLEQNEDIRRKQLEYGTVPAEFIEVPLDYPDTAVGGAWKGHLNGFVMKPANMNPNEKHPLLMFCYGGPGSQQALDQWKGANYWWFQMLVQQGFIVACVDNRGTGARGEEFKKMTYMQLGKLETQDQIAAAKFFGEQSYIDPARIGIFGWSYGGYMSSLCLLKGNEVFNSAIAVAPVTNWKWYDSVYTERYMRTHEENKQGYEENSPVNFTDQLKGNYLLVHGLTDDNVHFQHSAEMANQLILNNKQYDAMIYPNRNHGISDKAAKLHLYRKMSKFLTENMNNAPVKP